MITDGVPTVTGRRRDFMQTYRKDTLQRHAGAVALDPAAWMPWNYTATLAARANAGADAAPG